MAPSFDAVSSLLCSESEGESLVFDDDDDDGVDSDGLEERFEHRNYQTNNINQNFCEEQILNCFPMLSEDCLTLIIKKECEHLPAGDYFERLKNGDFDLNARKVAIDWIHKAHSHFKFGPLSLYLSINYLDRFLSAYKLPAMDWTMQLLAVACLSLASKLDESEFPICQDLQVVEFKFIFEPRTIQRMEILVMSTLGWRMQAVTPFSFLDYFLNKILGGDHQINQRLSIAKATELILTLIKGINFLEFRPSEIAAAVAIYAAGETNQSVNTDEAIILVLIDDIDKDKILKCLELVRGVDSVRGYIKFPNGLAVRHDVRVLQL